MREGAARRAGPTQVLRAGGRGGSGPGPEEKALQLGGHLPCLLQNEGPKDTNSMGACFETINTYEVSSRLVLLGKMGFILSQTSTIPG